MPANSQSNPYPPVVVSYHTTAAASLSASSTPIAARGPRVLRARLCGSRKLCQVLPSFAVLFRVRSWFNQTAVRPTTGSSERLQQDQEKSDHVPGSVPAEATGGCESAVNRGPGAAEDEVESPGDGCCKRHSEITDLEGMAFGGVCERNWTFSGGVHDCK